MSISIHTPLELVQGIGLRARELRLSRNMTQDELADRAGIGVASVRRFEKDGTTTLDTLARIACALNAGGDLDAIFRRDVPESLDVFERPVRQRASRR